MGQSAEEVRRDIERTRADMGYTLDAMGDRMSPKRMVARRTGRVTGAFRSARTAVRNAAMRSGEDPLALPLRRSRMTPSRKPPLPICSGWPSSSETFSRSRTPVVRMRTRWGSSSKRR